MLKYIIKLNLLLMGLVYFVDDITATTIVGLLAVITITSLNQYFNKTRFSFVSSAIFVVACFAMTQLAIFFPVLVLDLKGRNGKFLAVAMLAPIVIFAPPIAILIALAFLVEHLLDRFGRLKIQHTTLQDLHTEQKTALTQKAKEMEENQEQAAHLATLAERSRIARDIHDNIGHVLSRAILQTAALRTINKDEVLTDGLAGLQETLSGSMETIRGSVHDLKDDSIDLYHTLRQIFDGTSFEVQMHYDMPDNLPNDVKYCFLMAAKEALTNTTKHGVSATRFSINVQEHPAMYQLKIMDNGTKPPKNSEGMGLQNIEARVKTIGGYCSFGYDGGFKIFITLPKAGDVL